MSLNGVSQVSNSPPYYEEIKVATEDQIPSQVLNLRLVGQSANNLTLQWSMPEYPKTKSIEYEVWAIPLADDVMLAQNAITKKASFFLSVSC